MKESALPNRQVRPTVDEYREKLLLILTSAWPDRTAFIIPVSCIVEPLYSPSDNQQPSTKQTTKQP